MPGAQLGPGFRRGKIPAPSSNPTPNHPKQSTRVRKIDSTKLPTIRPIKASGQNKSPKSASTSTKSTDVVQAPVNLYRNEERSQALRLCGWPYDREASTSQQQLGPLLDKLEEDGQISRAAALAVFHLKIRKAIKILTRAGQQKNDISSQLVALALAGFTDNRDALWQEMCAAQCTTLGDPYLRAAFAFLTSPSDKYELVLVRSISIFNSINPLNCPTFYI